MSPQLPSHDLSGRVALVTGSSTGLGLAIAESLGRRGAKVAMNYAHNVERAERGLEQVRATGVEAELFRADVCDSAAVEGLVRDVADRLGAIDILVPNATGPQPQRPIEEYDWAFYQEMLDFFVKSPYLLTRAILPHLKRQRWGRIVNIGSEVVDRAVPNFSAYVAAKGAQRAWTRSMSQELAPWNITVNMVSPGWIPVERHEHDPQELKDEYRAIIPLNRWGVPGDIGEAVAHFASEAGGFSTGQTLVVNGGNTTI
jgi:3-oxoacyl-[acyl-carrier protein] reductase